MFEPMPTVIWELIAQDEIAGKAVEEGSTPVEIKSPTPPSVTNHESCDPGVSLAGTVMLKMVRPFA
jgi:hypothetical protein